MSKKNSFVISMANPIGTSRENNATYEYYKKVLFDTINGLGLTVAGEDFPPVRSGVEEAGFGNCITIGTVDSHDVEWVRRLSYVCEKGYTPVLDLIKDWKLIIEKLMKYYEDKYQFTLRYGTKITIHDGFLKVGTEIVTFDELSQVVRKWALRV